MIDKIKTETNWYKKALLILKFHELRSSQNPTNRKFKWRILDTAEELEFSVGYVSESIRLAKSKNVIIQTLSREYALRVLKGKI